MGQHNSHQPYPFGFTKTTTSQEPNPPQSLKEKRTKRATNDEEGTTAIVKQKQTFQRKMNNGLFTLKDLLLHT
jgi:hypothetical protein